MSEIREYTIEIKKDEEINVNDLLENTTLEKKCDSLYQMIVDANLSVVSDFKNIAESFGLICKEITQNISGLKGKTYIVYDDIVDLINNLKGTIDIESLMNNTIDFEQSLKSKVSKELLITNGCNKEINSLKSALFQEII